MPSRNKMIPTHHTGRPHKRNRDKIAPRIEEHRSFGVSALSKPKHPTNLAPPNNNRRFNRHWASPLCQASWRVTSVNVSSTVLSLDVMWCGLMLGARTSVVTVRTSTLASARSNSLAVGLPRSGDGFSGAMTLAALPLVMANDTIEKLMRIANVAANGQNNARELLAVARRRTY